MTEQEEQQSVLLPWEPLQLREASPAELRFSKGFLRSRPEKWFPGFSAQWQPLLHALSAEVRVQEIKPLLLAPRSLTYCFGAGVEGEALALCADESSADALIEAVVPGAARAARGVILEYLARRFFGSLALAWSGPAGMQAKFDADMRQAELDSAGAVKISCMVNQRQVEIWVLTGPVLTEKFDGLWRRQLQAETGVKESVEIGIEVAQLGVPPSMLSDYTRSGTVVDLAVQAGDMVTLRMNGRPWLPARLLRSARSFVIEVLPGSVPPVTIAPGATRLGIELGSFVLEPARASELAQVGAIHETGIATGNQVQLVINRQQAAAAILCTYQDRFAVSVI